MYNNITLHKMKLQLHFHKKGHNFKIFLKTAVLFKTNIKSICISSVIYNENISVIY